MATISMIGENHNDPDGEVKLERLLQNLNPEFVLLEGSESTYNAQVMYLAALKKEIDSQKPDEEMAEVLLATQTPKGFSTRATSTYCRINKSTKMVYFDDQFEHRTEEEINGLCKRTVRDFMKDYSKELAGRMLSALRIQMEAFYKLSDSALKANKDQILWSFVTEWHIGDRDQLMEEKLRKVIEEHRPNKIATVTGIKHIIRLPNSTFAVMGK